MFRTLYCAPAVMQPPTDPRVMGHTRQIVDAKGYLVKKALILNKFIGDRGNQTEQSQVSHKLFSLSTLEIQG